MGTVNAVVTWWLFPAVFLIPQPEVLKPGADVWGLCLADVLHCRALPNIAGV